MEIILPSLITGGLSLIGVIITNLVSNTTNTRKITDNIKEENAKIVNDLKLEVTKHQAITDTKIEELTREVKEHNNFAKRIPVVENEIKHLQEYHKKDK